MLEVEAKVRVPGFDAVRRRLRALGAARADSSGQDDLFFRHPARDFAATDETLRLRRQDGRMALTYKGPKQPSAAKARTEETVPVAADPTTLLGALGFTPAYRLRKEREAWRLGELEVALDSVAGLGSFVEVEALREDAAAAERVVTTALRDLGLADLARESRSYLELALEAGAAGVERV